MEKLIKVTLDTNCVINTFDKKTQTATSKDALSELVKLATKNQISVVLTTIVESDLMSDKDDKRRESFLNFISYFDVIGSRGTTKVVKDTRKEIKRILFPGGFDKGLKSYKNRENDIDHLVGHIINSRDIFVTDDHGILNKSETLENTFGLIVMKPYECLSFIETNLEQHQNNLQRKTIIDTKYWRKGLSGKVSFDYSNNNGVFIIGNGKHLFETKWSKASDIAIHAYNDMPSVSTIALAKDLNDLSKLTNPQIYDSSSRSRTVELGQILIIRNINNIYATVKVTKIHDDSRKDKSDLLEFEYLIHKATKRNP